MAAIAVCAWSRPVGNRLVAARRLVAAVIGTWKELLKPNFSASACSASAPRSMPMLANAVLHETASAFCSVVLPSGPHAEPDQLRSDRVLLGSGSSAGPGTTVLGVYLPDSRAAAAVTSLKVEPGGSVIASGRLSIG